MLFLTSFKDRNLLMNLHKIFMQRCLELSEKGLGYVAPNPLVGCVIVHDNKIIGEGYHQSFGGHHAEVNAINSVKDKSLLKNSTLYVTLEPCAMCAGAIVLSKIENLYFGAYDTKSGACGSVLNITNNKSLNHKCNVYGGILDFECSEVLKTFFIPKR